jgi:hypothetical protein
MLSAVISNARIMGWGYDANIHSTNAILFRFTSDASDEVGGYGSDSYRRKDIVKWGDELGFDDFDSDIVYKTF